MGKGPRKNKEQISRVNIKFAQRAASLQKNLCFISICEKNRGSVGTDNLEN